MEIQIGDKATAGDGYQIKPLEGLSISPMGYYLKPNGEIGKLPADDRRQEFYRAKGFEFLGLEKDVDLVQIQDRLKRVETRKERSGGRKTKKGGKRE